jgi:hypothetical protein
MTDQSTEYPAATETEPSDSGARPDTLDAELTTRSRPDPLDVSSRPRRAAVPTSRHMTPDYYLG